MPSQTSPSSDQSSSPFFETLMKTNRDTSPFLLTMMMLGLNPTSPHQEPQNQPTPRDSRDRIILINPTTQNVVIIERNSTNNNNNNSNLSSLFDSLINNFFSDKTGQPPASKASIDAMRSVEVVKDDGDDDGDEQCVVCLEGWRDGDKVKEMPCKHRFHGECIEKWLNIHGSCPVCRYEMPCDDGDGDEKMRGEEGDGENGVGVWVGFSVSRGVGSESGDSLASDQEMEELD